MLVLPFSLFVAVLVVGVAADGDIVVVVAVLNR